MALRRNVLLTEKHLPDISVPRKFARSAVNRFSLKSHKKRKGTIFSHVPVIRIVTIPNVDDINAYIFHENPKGGLRCPKCGVSLSAARGKYGVYVQCGGILQHRFNLEDI